MTGERRIEGSWIEVMSNIFHSEIMDYFDYREGTLYCEEIPVSDLIQNVDDVETPAYMYSRKTYREHFAKLKEAFSRLDALVCYSAKANTNPALLSDIAEMGGGVDVVSGGELEVALSSGIEPDHIFYSGVGKTEREIQRALEAGIRALNVESGEELNVIEQIAREVGTRPGLCVRVNPDVNPETHRYITTGRKENKFGVDPETAFEMAEQIVASDVLRLEGLHSHIGSQITELDPYRRSLSRNLELLEKIQKEAPHARTLNIGGGFGVYYRDREARPAGEYAEAIAPLLEGHDVDLALEPGRFVVGNAGILVTRVLYRKPSGPRTFVVCDSGMNHMIRPALYDAYHRIWPVTPRGGKITGDVPGAEQWEGETETAKLVGPICETADALCEERELPRMERGDLVSVFTAGAYGYVMSSHYNLHPKPAEILVDENQFREISRRESLEDLTGNYCTDSEWRGVET